MLEEGELVFFEYDVFEREVIYVLVDGLIYIGKVEIILCVKINK